MGYTEEATRCMLKQATLEAVNHAVNHANSKALKLMRKPSLEREADSGAGSSRSDSPRLMDLGPLPLPGRQYSPPPPPLQNGRAHV